MMARTVSESLGLAAPFMSGHRRFLKTGAKVMLRPDSVNTESKCSGKNSQPVVDPAELPEKWPCRYDSGGNGNLVVQVVFWYR